MKRADVRRRAHGCVAAFLYGALTTGEVDVALLEPEGWPDKDREILRAEVERIARYHSAFTERFQDLTIVVAVEG